jgi:hypothetical protein
VIPRLARKNCKPRQARWRGGVAGDGFDETSFLVHETILASLRKRQETNVGHAALHDQQWSSIMSAFLTLIYREYCKACLAEMQKHFLGS